MEYTLGTGKLSWFRGERLSDRYGAVYTEGQQEYSTIREFAEEGVRGKLVAYVLDTRKSHHIGDAFRGLRPVTPEVGERIVLCENGTFFAEPELDGFVQVGIRPDDGRDSDWMDPNMLYRAHDQTVKLVFVDEE